MSKLVIALFSIIFFSCSSSSVIELKKNEFENVYFDAVSKSIQFNEFEESKINLIGHDFIQDWYKKYIKTNGLDGSLLLTVEELSSTQEKREDYFKFTVFIRINFDLENQAFDRKKTFNLSASEFAEISGPFSIEDQEKISSNVYNLAINKINIELQKLI